MDILVLIALAGLVLCAVGILLVWALSSVCRLLATLVSKLSGNDPP